MTPVKVTSKRRLREALEGTRQTVSLDKNSQNNGGVRVRGGRVRGVRVRGVRVSDFPHACTFV